MKENIGPDHIDLESRLPLFLLYPEIPSGPLPTVCRKLFHFYAEIVGTVALPPTVIRNLCPSLSQWKIEGFTLMRSISRNFSTFASLPSA
jgi:hypothetical protein